MKLQFRFEEENVTFTTPVEVIEVYDVEEVEQAFHHIEKWLGKGCYIAGYVAYEAAPAFDPALQVRETEGPLLWFGVFEAPVNEEEEPRGTYEISEWQLDADFESYQQGISDIKNAIENGDTYQVNYTARWKAAFKGDSYTFFEKLARRQQGRYSAYLETGTRTILSASPELFFKKEKGTITTRPMKGTAARGKTFAEDIRKKERLAASEKEQAENVMIVDLLRNDIGRIAGKVRVPRLFSIETYPTVHQMTSTVEGEIRENSTVWELFEALFPCGSITGAPKVKTMEYISELEETPRDVYCGAIGYITPKKDMIFNVPIRTVMIEEGEAIYGSGGGITWDSQTSSEYEEMKTKAKLLDAEFPEFDLLETMRLANREFPLLERHLNRLKSSAAYFSYPFDEQLIRERLKNVKDDWSIGRVRLLLSEEGEVQVETYEHKDEDKKYRAVLAETPINAENPFYYHKTTHREIYNIHPKKGADTVLLWNEREELTEFTFANLVVKKNGKYVTPPIESGLLAGTKREELLEQGEIQAEVLFVEELSDFEEVWMVNGLRGWMKVEMEE
ncbi:aminodeoxychorismate synthase component I [Salimicrobium halophilum]|uniref:Para-aminobenzoate synthetase / 4-amino-4-deoxychorismate lyase n=1 Tax=Salimicrobium halophilum TaxID=86666 RepID=A0A1G8SX35_9BACI|nr:aminodeoxychorismate synthase component I [Salimicrobium halophilum]SDJ33744.1 para-aminobenzoate synthetase / 4-amino-4-deoxychorismate lyase [Salimicrobium halophilum]